jgi:arsenate reductase-like glutaredoxin family protein
MKEAFSLDELRTLIEKVPLDEILNKKGIVYKERRQELEQLTPEELLEEMAKEPKLIRRPLIILEDRVIVGYDEKQFEKSLV